MMLLLSSFLWINLGVQLSILVVLPLPMFTGAELVSAKSVLLMTFCNVSAESVNMTF
jgi:hypothetical protein